MADNIKVTFEGEVSSILKAFQRIEKKLDVMVKGADKSTKAVSKDFDVMASKIDASLQRVAKSTTKSMGVATAGMNRLGMATRQTAKLISKQQVTASLLKMSDGFSGLQRQGVLALAELNASGIRFGQTMSRVAGLVVRRFGSIALSFATIGAGVFTGKAVAGAISFEKALANVGTILADGAPKLEAFRQGVLGLATATSKDLVDLTEGLYSAISAGIPQTLAAGGAIDFLKNAALAAQTGLAETKDAVLAGTVVLNTFGRSAGDNTQIFDKMFEAVRLGVFTFDEMAVALGKGAGIAKTANLTFDEYLSTMTAISTKGRTASQSVTALRQLIISIATPTSRAKEIAKEYGFELGQNAIRAKGFKKVLEDMTRGIGQNVGALKKVLRRVEGLTGAAALGADDLARFALTFDSITDASGRLSEAAKFQEATFTHNFNLMRNQFSAITAEVVQSAIPALVQGFKDIRLAMEDMNQVSLRSGFKGFSESLTDLVRLLFSLRTSFVLLFKVILLGKALAFFKGVVGSMTASIGAAALRTEQWTASLAKNTTVTTVNTAIQKNHATAMISNIKSAGVAAVSQDNLSRAFFGNIKASGLASAGVVANTAKLGFMATAAKGATFALGALNKALSLLGILTGIGAVIFVLVELISLVYAAGEAAGALWHSWSGGAAKAKEETDKVRRVVELTTRRTNELVAEIKKFGRAFANSPFIGLPSAPGQLTFGAGIFTDAVIKETTKNGKKVLEINEEVSKFVIANREATAQSLIDEVKQRQIAKQGELDDIKELNAAREKDFGVSGGLVPSDRRQQERDKNADLETEAKLKKEIIALDSEGRALENKKKEISGQLTIVFKEQLKAKQDAEKLGQFSDTKDPGAKRRVKDLLGPLLERERIKSARNEINTIKRRTQALIVEAKARENLADKAGLLNSAKKLITTLFDKRTTLAKVSLEQQIANADRLEEREKEAINEATEREKEFIELGLSLEEQKTVLLIRSSENKVAVVENIEQQHTLKMAAFQAQLTKELKVLGENRLKDFKDILDEQNDLVSKGLSLEIDVKVKKLEEDLTDIIKGFVEGGLTGAIGAFIVGFKDSLTKSGIDKLIGGLIKGGAEGAKSAMLGIASIFGGRLISLAMAGASFLVNEFGKFLGMAADFTDPSKDPKAQKELTKLRGDAQTAKEAAGQFTSVNASPEEKLAAKEANKAAEKDLAAIAREQAEINGRTFGKVLDEEFDRRMQIIENFADNLPVLFEKLTPFIERVAAKLVQVIPGVLTQFAAGVPKLIGVVVREFPKITAAIINSIPQIVSAFISAIPELLINFASAIGDLLPQLSGDLVIALVDAFTLNIDKFIEALAIGMSKAFEKLVNKLNPLSSDNSPFKNPVSGALGRVFDPFDIVGKIPVLGGIKSFLGFETGGVVPNMQNFAAGGMVEARRNALTQMIGGITAGATPIMAHAGEGVLTKEATARAGGEQGIAAMNQGAPAPAPVINIEFNQKSDSGRLLRKIISDMFVAEARSQGAKVRSARDVVSSSFVNLPSTVGF